MRRAFVLALLLFSFFLPGCVEQQPATTSALTSTPTSTPTQIPAIAASPTFSEPTVTAAASVESNKTLDAKPLQERLQKAYDLLHAEDSDQQVFDDFPDVELVYVDNPTSGNYPSEILPFRYYYSKEANKTFSICEIHRTIFICNGKIDRLITTEDMYGGACDVTPVYKNIPR